MRDWVEVLGARLYRHVAAPLALFCMAAIVAGGFGHILFALWLGVKTGRLGLDHLFKGIELFFLAPLAYLVFGTAITLVVNVRRRLWSLNRPAAHLDAAARERLDETFDVVHRVKQSVAALFVAVVLTDLIGQVPNREKIGIELLAVEVLTLLLGLAYYLAQASSASHLRPHGRAPSPDARTLAKAASGTD